jgi:cytochrome c oxidase subunit 2
MSGARQPAKRDGLIVALLTVALSAVGEALTWNLDIFPAQDAREAAISDEAFRILVRLAVPVFVFVLVMLAFSVIRFRSRGVPSDVGPSQWGSPKVYTLWLGITGLLALVLIVNPGLTGLAEIRGRSQADLVVRLTGSQWTWTVSYPSYGNASSLDEMVLPVGERIRFEVTSTDVIHSFWIPAFRIKVDAVPGRTTVIYATPDRIDSYEADFNLRVQCAELCGLGHAFMKLPVRVVEEPEFLAWVKGLSGSG